MERPIEYSILIPAYNSENTIAQLLAQIDQYFMVCGYSFEIIVVNDASFDDTKIILERERAERGNLKVLSLKKNVGQQRALLMGLKFCKGLRVITMDDDLQHPVYEIDKLIQCADKGADLVFGVYDSREDQSYRKSGSHWIGRFFKWRFKALKGLKVSSFRLIDQSVYQKVVRVSANRFVYLSAELIPFAKKIDNVSVNREDRQYGKSGYNAYKLIKLGGNLVMQYGLNRRKNPSRILMVGAGSCQINGIMRLKEAGVEVVVADYAKTSKGKALADIAVLADAFDPKAILEAAKKYEVDGIITVGTDQPLLSVVKAAETMALPRFISSDVAYKVTNKREMKRLFAENKIPTVPFAIVKSDFQEKDLAHMVSPYVIKPLDSQGQRGIFLLDSIEEIRKHFDAVLSFSRESEILIEQFYPNEEITISGWVVEGQCIPLTITDRVTFRPEEHIGVCVSHEYPSKHFVEHGKTIVDLSEKICQVFDITSGPIYFQMLVGKDGVMVNEIACRLGGAYEDVTIPWVTNVDVLDLNIMGCFGENYDVLPREGEQKFFSTQLFFGNPGQIQSQTPLEILKAMDCVLDAGYNFDIGESIPLTESASARAGFVIITGDSEASLIRHIESVFDELEWLSPEGINLIRRGKRNERP